MSVANLDDVGARDSVEAVGTGRCQHSPVSYGEEVGCIAGRDKSPVVKHQCLVGSRLDRLVECHDVVETRMRVERHVEHVRPAGANCRREQRKARFQDFRIRLLVFGDDGDCRSRHRVAGILVRGLLQAARDHQPDMDAGLACHSIPFKRCFESGTHVIAGHSNVDVDRSRAHEQAVQMAVHECKPSAMHPEPFPDAVAQDPASVKDRDQCLFAGHEVAVEINFCRLVPWVGSEVLASGHDGILPLAVGSSSHMSGVLGNPGGGGHR